MRFVLGMLVAVAALNIVGCGESSSGESSSGTSTVGDISGTYVVDLDHLKASLEKQGKAELFEIMKMTMKDVSIEVASDGTYARKQIHGTGEKETTKGAWKAVGDKYQFVDDDDKEKKSAKTLRREGTTLIMEEDDMKLHFVRK